MKEPYENGIIVTGHDHLLSTNNKCSSLSNIIDDEIVTMVVFNNNKELEVHYTHPPNEQEKQVLVMALTHMVKRLSENEAVH